MVDIWWSSGRLLKLGGNRGIRDKYIEVISIGRVSQEVVLHVLKIIEEKFKTIAKSGQALPLPAKAFDPARNQYNASIILNEIRKAKSSGAIKALGIINKDIFSMGLNYVFGQAILGGCCGVISLTRLHIGVAGYAGRKLFFERLDKEAVHELGHTFGLQHCSDPKCVMVFSSNIADTDRKSTDFCDKCGRPAVSS